MKKLFSIALVGASLALYSCSAEKADRDLSVAEFKEATSETGVVVLDVRTPGEVAQGMIPGAIHIDWNGPDFEAQVQSLNKNEPVYVYCKSGGRSSSACSKMSELGFTEVHNLVGGITAWQGAGYEVASPNLSKGEE